MKFILYSRSYCHLCDDMLDALRSFGIGTPWEIDVVDVDQDPELVKRFDELVPVLFGQKGNEAATEICHYHLDPAALRKFLAS